jgi:hypothetical protein
MLEMRNLYDIQNEVDARVEANAEAMRKITVMGTVTPASWQKRLLL